MQTEYPIYFNDLTPEAQQKYLIFQQVESAKDLNEDIIPLATLYRDVSLQVADKEEPLEEGQTYYAIEKDGDIYAIRESIVDCESVTLDKNPLLFADLKNAINHCNGKNYNYKVYTL